MPPQIRIYMRVFTCIAFALLPAACTKKLPSSITTREEESSASLPVETQSLKIVYGTRFRPEQLSISRENEIRNAARAAGDGNQIWFAYVRSNREEDQLVDVYFQPLPHDARVRRGDVITISRSSFVAAIQQALNQPPSTQPSVSTPRGYVFVLRTLNGFDAKSPPLSNEMPFEVEGDFTDSQLEQIVDFYCGAKGLSPSPYSFPAVNARLPILTIRQSGQNVEIKTGTIEGPLSGAGQELLLQWTPAGLKLVQLSEWVS